MNSNKNLIEVKNLSKSYNIEGEEFLALDNVSFTLSKNESIGLIGSNGSGKSTLLKILSGLIKPSSGTALINGKINSLIEIGSNFIPDLTGRENVKQFLELNNISKGKIDAIIEEVKDFSELNHFFEKPVKFYSSGMFVRLALSAGFHINADIFLIDEVLMAGDAVFREKVSQKFNDLINEGCAIILASHNVEEIMNNTKFCILLEKGKLKDIKLSEAVMKDYYFGLAKKHSEKQEKMKASLVSNLTIKSFYNLNKDELKNKNIEILKVEILDNEHLLYSSFITFKVNFKKLSKDISLFPNIKVYNVFYKPILALVSLNNQEVFDFFNQTRDYIGEISFTCSIPNNLLTKGVYYYDLSFITYPEQDSSFIKEIYRLPNKLSFEVKGNKMKDISDNSMEVFIKPSTSWNFNKIY